MICNKCNFQNEKTAKFCRNCGTELIEQQTNFYKNPEKRKYLWILGSILIVAISVIFALYNPSDKVQLLETLTYYGKNYCKKYVYDEQNRIIKILRYNDEIGYNLVGTSTFTYFGDNLIEVINENFGESSNIGTRKFAKSGNKITITDTGVSFISIIELNDDGYPIRIEHSSQNRTDVYTYSFERGNLTKELHRYAYTEEDGMLVERESRAEYEYDRKKSPFYHCKTPKWYLFAYCELNVPSVHNNLTANVETINGSVLLNGKYKYEYDKAGFPIKQINECDGEHCILFLFQYK